MSLIDPSSPAPELPAVSYLAPPLPTLTTLRSRWAGNASRWRSPHSASACG